MTDTTTPQQRPAHTSWWTGRGDLAIGALALIAAGLLILGTVTMEVRGEAQPGPQFFPIIVIILLIATGGWITVAALLPRKAEPEPETWHRPDISEDMLADISGTDTQLIQLETMQGRWRRGRRRPAIEGGTAPATAAIGTVASSSFDWRTFGLVLGGVAGFAVLLDPVGWILSAAMLFWVVAYALGSKRPIFDIGVGLLMSSLVQLAFSAGLGLNLPSGLIGWIF